MRVGLVRQNLTDGAARAGLSGTRVGTTNGVSLMVEPAPEVAPPRPASASVACWWSSAATPNFSHHRVLVELCRHAPLRHSERPWSEGRAPRPRAMAGGPSARGPHGHLRLAARKSSRAPPGRLRRARGREGGEATTTRRHRRLKKIKWWVEEDKVEKKIKKEIGESLTGGFHLWQVGSSLTVLSWHLTHIFNFFN